MPGITDVHVHIEPFRMLRPEILEAIRRTVPRAESLGRVMDDPRALLDILDAAGVERACLINYVAPEVIGLKEDVNEYISQYSKEDPRRLLPFGSVHPKRSKDPRRDVERLASRLEIRGLKIHPPHQLFPANAYADAKMPALRTIYKTAERIGLPVMVHTGTSVFPGARSKYGDPIALDDVAQDFPDLTVIMAHGGRPLWCDTAFFLVRRHPNVYLDISSIPPRRLFEWFPRFEEIADKVLFGSDWPGPMIPGIREEIDGISSLPLSRHVAEKLFTVNAARIFR